MNLFLAPHHDDETLFGAFTLLRHKPTVLICLQSDTGRREETAEAMDVLGCQFETMAISEADPDWGQLRANLRDHDAEIVFAPQPVDDGNPDHNRIGEIAWALWPNRVTFYTTYTSTGKQTGMTMVDYEPEWIPLKLRALACYTSQFQQPGRAVHFLRDQHEFYA